MQQILKFFLDVLDEESRKLLTAALEIVDKQSVSKSEIFEVSCAQSKRSFWRVSGAQAITYTCTLDFCTCPSFAHISRHESPKTLCKHMLAAMISHILKFTSKTEIDSSELVTKISLLS